MELTDPVDITLTDEERHLLRSGLSDWGGPAMCTEELAVAMGFRSVEDLFAESGRLWESIGRSEPLTPRDWTRTLLATEIVFASDVIGSGSDWSATTGLSDERTIRLLRGVQGKLIGLARDALHRGLLGTLPRRDQP
jgi:hypothetical protein